MKKALVILLSLIILAGICYAAKDPYSLPVKKLYSAPSADSNLILDIPIEVKLLDVSEDGNWYKVKISYNIGPFNYTYVGWSNIPVGEILASRAEKVAVNSSLP
ncbi:MAG: hypothetical protein PHH60_01370 [Candidatus Margulisbacteria bacterium]|nr:hypothetical protein [Candidatus Margulisiibacteriota bacterium]